MRTWYLFLVVVLFSFGFGGCLADPAEEELTGVWTMDVQRTVASINTTLRPAEAAPLLEAINNGSSTLTFGADGAFARSGALAADGTWRVKTASTFGGILATLTVIGGGSAEPSEFTITIEGDQLQVRPADEPWTEFWVRQP